MYIESFRAMNTDIVMIAEGEEGRAREGLQAAREFIETSERRFTRFSETSELSALNRGAGEWFEASPELLELVSDALECHRKTHGLFDPSTLPDLKRAGYTRSLDEIRAAPTGEAPASMLIPVTGTEFSATQIDASRGLIRLPEDMQIDLGGIAKGWISEKAADILRGYARAAAVNAGGDMFMSGYPDDQEYWEVGLEDPRDRGQDVAILQVTEGALATSSVAKRTWLQGGQPRHHLIDPRTHQPAETPWLSMTVMAREAVIAETFAKAFLMAGDEERELLRQENPELTALGVDKESQLVVITEPIERENAY